MKYDYKFGNNYFNYFNDIGFKTLKYNILAPEQSQKEQPGMEYLMNPRPIFDNPNYKGSNKLKGKVAIITGGDSGIGRAVAISYVKEGAKLEAENTLKIIQGKQFDLPIFYDMEESEQANLGKDTLTEMANEWCRIIKNAGYNAGIYANLNWFKNYLNPYEIKKEENYIWLALWNNDENPNVDFPVDFWQYSSKGKLDGIKSFVDLDKSYTKDFPQHGENLKTNEDLATEVIHGLWGNGGERKDRLTKAGYNYDEIQRIVNERLLGKKKSNYDLATEVIRGLWGNGGERKDRLTNAGYNYNEIQKIVNERLK